MLKKTSEESSPRRPLKEIGLFLADILYNAVIIIVLVVLIRTFLISPFRVIGSSMADTLKNNEFILIDKLNYHLGEPERGDTVVFLPPITNKYPHKFEESIVFGASGEGVLPIEDLKTEKNVFYCQNPLVRLFWFCQDEVEKGDLIYFRPIEESKADSLIDRSWKQAEKKVVNEADIKAGQLTFLGQEGQSYLVRIYSSTGPEYFVKRIIGVPGDTIRIENGRVYLKMVDGNEFIELEEAYLNDENAFSTYFNKTPGMGDFVVPEGYNFVLGDNRGHSNDSRHWFSPIDEQYTPFVDSNNIRGKVLIVLWPPNDLRLIPAGVLEN
ncbi:signal peptidase I [Patescibacteria group bacterium]|nr:signal peptidase I [Patescibacteria group bacterium]